MANDSKPAQSSNVLKPAQSSNELKPEQASSDWESSSNVNVEANKVKVYPGENPFDSPPSCPFISRDWDRKPPSVVCGRRVKRDLKLLIDNPLPGIFIAPDEENFTRCNAMIIGNFETPYEGGFFNFHVRVPHNYPAEPPRVCSVTSYRFGHRVRFNPNLYTNGRICLSILNTWNGPSWSPVFTLGYIFQSIQSTIFVADALCNEPGFENQKAANSQLVRLYDMYVRHETIRVAVIHTLKNTKKCNIDPTLVKTMENLFPDFYDSYMESCEELKKHDGIRIRIGPEVYRINFTPSFKELKKELVKINEELKKNGNLENMQS